MAKDMFIRKAGRVAQADSVVVIGLGRFGGALALELEAQGTEVLGIDSDEEIVQSYNGRLTHVVRADSTKEEVLRQLSVHEFDRAVVGIGTDLEASILTTSRLLTFKHPQIWAKAISEPHAEILAQLGVENVIRPEHDMGRRVAHLVRGSILDYVEFEDDFVMIRTQPPLDARNRPLGVLGLRDQYGITIVAVKRPGGTWQHTTAQTVLYDDDQIIVQGTKNLAERFSTLV
ncbi:trk system potassium uptake protein TrkA [Arthrobacter ulcerisalmonis]|uniref:potassium channel family protein n=1 Tax=Arthrobacter sp. B1I2 TaxID=3042263 RepID=UPI002788463F|nr:MULTISPECIES: TrkA family potassium uptake protein [Arthrobacter]MDQ0663161.1 trk system potassium uptake protein TrkA [Arthrobacter ulcerisalmonis]MDQ0731064.1 trk system potassium uptake protein TrkA [Arthrobacter sp. B1I2]